MKIKNTSEETKPPSIKIDAEQTVPASVAPKSRKKVPKKEEAPTFDSSPLPEGEAEAKTESESVNEAPKKRKRGGWIALGILGMLLIGVAGAAIGYYSAIQVRKAEEVSQIQTDATTQYELSLQDIKDNNLAMAKRRLEYVIQIYPSYPEAGNKLTEVMVAMAQANQSSGTVPAIATVVPTKDTRDAVAIFTQAQQQYASQDWQNLYNSINSLRDLDPTYEAVKVDGFYYLALRNVGISNITNGNLEVGLYNFAVAEKIGPLDADAESYRIWARMYLNAASNWGINWSKAVDGFSTLYGMVPSLADFNGVSVRERYARSLAGYGDYLQSTYDWCGAVSQYETSIEIMSLQSVIDILPDAREKCATPPATPTPTLDPSVTPTP